MGKGPTKPTQQDGEWATYTMDDANRLAAELERNWYADTNANRVCHLCTHPQREGINALLLRGATWTDVRKYAGLDPDAWNSTARLRRHRDFHLRLKIQQLTRPRVQVARLQLYPRDAHEDKPWWYFCQAYAGYSECIDNGEKALALQYLREMRNIDETHLGMIPKSKVIKDVTPKQIESAPPIQSNADMKKVFKALELSRAHKEDYERREVETDSGDA